MQMSIQYQQQFHIREQIQFLTVKKLERVKFCLELAMASAKQQFYLILSLLVAGGKKSKNIMFFLVVGW